MWSIQCYRDPVFDDGTSHSETPLQSVILNAEIDLDVLLEDSSHMTALKEGGRDATVALADFCARQIAKTEFSEIVGPFQVLVRPLDRMTRTNKRNKKEAINDDVPFILERSDIFCQHDKLILNVRAMMYPLSREADDDIDEKKMEMTDCSTEEILKKASLHFLTQSLDLNQGDTSLKVMEHVACSVLQCRMREKLHDMKVVAFIADGSILPRRSGASSQPMQSPPALPFKAPSESRLSATVVVAGSRLSTEISVQMGLLSTFLRSDFSSNQRTTIIIHGMAVPEGITLIVGGGYHGKSTMLRTIAAGVYNKIPGDGREFCVSVNDAVCVRAEDGRYVNNCNVSAFISNLPAPQGMISSLDTRRFSTREASGSTSQAANVSEAIEMGASALLVDEDVSAANFMARDGRMRALVADESITPLLYRVNGLYQSHRISSIVVVGGVGDWLDVPNNVILLDKYVALDATKKAESISRQFSYGHVQYAGRGVVHRLEWDKGGTPIPRRPSQISMKHFQGKIDVSLVEGANMMVIEAEHHVDNDVLDDSIGCLDMSRCEQLIGKKPQLLGCGICVSWLLKMSQLNPSYGIADLLSKVDEWWTSGGIASLLRKTDSDIDPTWRYILATVGFVYRPRKYEIYMALTRMRGMDFEEMPIKIEDNEDAAKLEAERKKQEQLTEWNARRKTNRFQ